MKPAIIPTLKYENAADAIEWLCNVFGFEQHLVVPGPGDTIDHAQLTIDGGMIMLGSSRDTAFDNLQKSPKAVGGIGTQSPYIIVQDIDAHYARALAAGAEIVLALAEQDYGGKLYSCRDPEGHLWNFGSYNPWE